MNGKIGAQVVVVLGCLLGTAPRYAHAQSSNQVAAEALFREARKLLDAGQYREACEKLDASRRLDPAVGTLLNLARCREKIGQTATAWATYHDAIRAAKATGQADREKAARERADALEPTLPRLTVIVSAEARADKVQVRRDGVALPTELWGVTLPVDPGEHTVDSTAAGKRPWAIKTSLLDRGTATVTVPPLQPAASSSLGGPIAPSSHAEPATASVRPTHDSSAPPTIAPRPDEPQGGGWNGGKTVAVAFAGLGVAGLVVGATQWSKFEQKKDDGANACLAAGCNQDQRDQAVAFRQEAQSARTIGIVAAAVGGAALVGAAVVWLASGTRSGATSVAIVPVGGAKELGIGLGGAW